MHAADYQPIRATWIRRAKTVLAYSVIYLIVDVALNEFAFADAWTIIWPLNGVNVALLLMRPRSQWPWMLLGIEIGTGVGEWFDDNTAWMEVCQWVFSATEVVISASLLPAFVTLESWLRTPRIFVRFSAALLLGPGISGLMAAVLFHYAKGQPFLLAFNNWATADALGIAATMPLALSLRTPQMRALFQREALPRTMGVLILAFAGSAIAVVGVLFISVYFTTQSLALFPASLMLMERRRMAAELHDTNARLTILASLDGLTGIANRRSFDERFAEEWSRAVRHRKPLALAMIDLDNFKQFNDLYGHLAGDRCLCAVAQALARQIQRPEDLVARFGGEELALLLPHAAAEGALTVVERIRKAILDLDIEHLGNTWKRVTVSVGYSALIPTQNDGQPRLLQLADAALCQAKSFGRNRVETISSIEGLHATAERGSTTGRNRIVRILGRGDR